MQVAKLTQDYYGFIGQSTLPNQQVGPDQTQQQRPRPNVLPAERLVEGELLKNRSKGGNPLSDLLQRGRFAGSAANSQEGDLSAHAAQRAINAYLGNAASSSPASYDQTRTVDYYA
jgi:succinate dehydrogenase/fumarate reductase flavoprotein subunit